MRVHFAFPIYGNIVTYCVPRKFSFDLPWRFSLFNQLPARLGKSCLAPEVLPLLVLGEACPVGPCEPVELQQGGR